MSADRMPDTQPQNPSNPNADLGGMPYAPQTDVQQQGTDAAGADGYYGGGEVNPAAAAAGEVEARPAEKAKLKVGTGTRIAQIAAAVLFLLAVVATTVMVFTDNGLWMRVGLLAALWSALFGAFLYAWERRRSGQAEEREAELKRVYSLELESEVAARREHDLRVKEALREEVRSENEQALDALRVEVMALRSQLEQLGVKPIVDTDRAVAGAAAKRIVTAAPGGAAIAADGSLPGGADAAGAPGGAEPAGAKPRGAVKPPVDGFEQLITEPSQAEPSGEVPPRPVVGGKRPEARPQTAAPTGWQAQQQTPSNEVTSTLRKIDASGAPQAGGTQPDTGAGQSGAGASPQPAREAAAPTPPIMPKPAQSQPMQSQPAARPAAKPAAAQDGKATAAQPAAAAQSAAKQDDGAIGLESFNLTPPPSFGSQGSLPDFDAPTGFEPFGVASGTGSSAAGKPSDKPAAKADDAPAAPATHAADSADEAAHSRHGDSGGTSVAELLARLGSDSGQSTGGRHHRRRAED